MTIPHETVETSRDRSGKAKSALDLVQLPNGGYYFSEQDFKRNRSRLSVKVWPDRATALSAERKQIRWHAWK